VALGQHRSTQRKVPRGRDDERRLTADIIELARQYGRYGYRKIAELLRQAGWTINDKRVERRQCGARAVTSMPTAIGPCRALPVVGCLARFRTIKVCSKIRHR
jgi:hypothetical protein